MATPVMSNVPGMVSGNVVGGAAAPMSVSDQATLYALQQRMKADEEARWARSAAMNNARMQQDKMRDAVQLMYKPQPGTTQERYKQPIGSMKVPGLQNATYAPPGLGGAQLGSWMSGFENDMMRKGFATPTVIQRKPLGY